MATPANAAQPIITSGSAFTVCGDGGVLANGNLTFDGFQDGFSLITSYKGNVTDICSLMS